VKKLNNEQNMKLMQIAMTHLPEAKALLDEQGVELDLASMQPFLQLLLNVMNEAYELGKSE
jgi:competence protein ComZ